MTAQKKMAQFEIPKELLSWQAPTRRFEERNKLWFVGLAILSGLVCVVLILLNELLLGLLALAFGFMVFTMSAVHPPVVKHSVYNTGMMIQGKMYLWEDLESFYIEESEKTLLLKTRLSFPSELFLFLQGDKLNEIQKLLLERLPFIESKKTDYTAVIDGFVDKFTQKLPNRITKKIKNPNEKLTINPEKNKLVKGVKKISKVQLKKK